MVRNSACHWFSLLLVYFPSNWSQPTDFMFHCGRSSPAASTPKSAQFQISPAAPHQKIQYYTTQLSQMKDDYTGNSQWENVLFLTWEWKGRKNLVHKPSLVLPLFCLLSFQNSFCISSFCVLLLSLESQEKLCSAGQIRGHSIFFQKMTENLALPKGILLRSLRKLMTIGWKEPSMARQGYSLLTMWKWSNSRSKIFLCNWPHVEVTCIWKLRIWCNTPETNAWHCSF